MLLLIIDFYTIDVICLNIIKIKINIAYKVNICYTILSFALKLYITLRKCYF